MKKEIIHVSGIETGEQEAQLTKLLSKMIGVQSVAVNRKSDDIKVEFETPTNLNSIEKEIYDSGYRVIN